MLFQWQAIALNILCFIHHTQYKLFLIAVRNKKLIRV